MALRVWLPLNGSLENKGCSDLKVANIQSGVTIDNNGKIGKCYTNSGTTISTVTPISISSKSFSMSAWVKLNTRRNNWCRAFGVAGDGTYAGLACEHTNGSNIGFHFYKTIDETNTNIFDVYPTTQVVDEWVHWTMCYDGIKYYIYKNGILLTSNNVNKSNIDFNMNKLYLFGGTSGNSSQCSLNDVRIYDHCLSPLEVKEISQGLILHYKLNNSSITNFSEIGNLIPNYKEMQLGTANVETGTWRIAGSSNMTRTRVQINDSPVGTCYCFQNVGIQTANDGSCYGIDNTTYFEPNTEYRISMFARIISGTEGYAGYNIYNISEELGGSYTKIDKNYRVTPLSADGSWTYCWYHFKTNSTATRNIYIGITTGETSVTTQMCLVRIDKWNDGMDTTKIIDSSGYENDGCLVNGTNETVGINNGRYQVCTSLLGTTVDSTSNTITGAQYLYVPLKMPAWTAITVAWWGNNIAYGRGGIFETTGTTGNIWEGSDYNTTAIANWDSTFGIFNGSTRVNIFNNFIKDSTWHHHAITFDGINVRYYCDSILKQTSALTGTLPAITGFKMGLGKAGGVYRQIKQKLNDLRIYVTALSADDIATLYHTPAQIDNLGGIHGFEFVEKTPNLLNPDLREWSKESNVTCVWNEETKYFDVNTNRDTSNTSRWGIFQNITVKPNTSYLFAVDMMGTGSAMGIAAQDTTTAWPSDRNTAGDMKRYYYILTTTATNTVGRVYLDIKPSINQIAHFKNIYLGEIGEIASIKQGGIFENEDMVEYNENGRITKSGELAGSNFIEK